jgi:catechol 2,3-dioxygenase-like lactoylglutathione lyase family enzyme
MMAFRYLVSDVERAKSFYVGLLGFKLVKQWGPAFAEVELGGVSVWLSGPQTSAAKPMPDGRKPEPGGWNRAVVIVEDLATRVEELKAAGVTFRNTLLSGPGGSQILAEDGEGNVVELFEPRD